MHIVWASSFYFYLSSKEVSGLTTIQTKTYQNEYYFLVEVNKYEGKILKGMNKELELM